MGGWCDGVDSGSDSVALAIWLNWLERRTHTLEVESSILSVASRGLEHRSETSGNGDGSIGWKAAMAVWVVQGSA
jgi:hypothetical protein